MPMLLFMLMLMIKPMMMMLALTLVLLPEAFKAVAYAVDNDVDVEPKMLNVARHLAVANDMMMFLLMFWS